MRKQTLHYGFVLLVVSLLLVGCTPILEATTFNPPAQSAIVEPTVTSPGPTASAQAPEEEEKEETMPHPDLTAYRPVQQAIADLATRLSVDPAEVTVVRVEEVDWPDGSLGCPRPDMRYKQMLVNGSFIQLQVGEQTYNYHNGGGRAPFLCTSKDEVLPEDLPDMMRGDPNV